MKYLRLIAALLAIFLATEDACKTSWWNPKKKKEEFVAENTEVQVGTLGTPADKHLPAVPDDSSVVLNKPPADGHMKHANEENEDRKNDGGGNEVIDTAETAENPVLETVQKPDNEGREKQGEINNEVIATDDKKPDLPETSEQRKDDEDKEAEKHPDEKLHDNSVIPKRKPGGEIPVLSVPIDRATDKQLQPIVRWLWNNDIKYFKEEDVKLTFTTDSKQNFMSKGRDKHSKLFSKTFDKQLLTDRPTHAALRDIFSVVSHINVEKRDKFFSEIKSSGLYKLLEDVLKSNSDDPEKYLKDLWFGEFQMNKVSTLVTSFRLVFIGVFESDKFYGLYHWFRIWSLESSNRLHYKGLVDVKKYPPPTSYPYIAKIRFVFGTVTTERLIMFYNSPEFDFVLFTINHLAKPDGGTTKVHINECLGLAITTSSVTYKGKKYITEASVARLEPKSSECNVDPK